MNRRDQIKPAPDYKLIEGFRSLGHCPVEIAAMLGDMGVACPYGANWTAGRVLSVVAREDRIRQLKVVRR